MTHQDRLLVAVRRSGFDLEVYRGVLVVRERRLPTPITTTYLTSTIRDVRVAAGTTLLVRFDNAVQVGYQLGPEAAAVAAVIAQLLPATDSAE